MFAAFGSGESGVLSPGLRVVDAPVGALTAEDRVMLARHKTALLGLPAGVTTPDDLPPDWHLLGDE